MEDDDKDQRNDEDNQNQSQDNGNGGNGSSSIGKYFGKADKNIKLVSSKFKSCIKVPRTQKKIFYTIESSAKNKESKRQFYQKAKIKFQYANYIQKLGGKAKAKLSMTPFDKRNIFTDLSFNLKRFPNKNTQNILDVKINNQTELITKLKRIRYYMNKSIKHQVDAEVTVNKNLVSKLSFNFDSLQKIDFQNKFKYVKNAHLKGKYSTKISQNGIDMTKFQFSAKLFTELDKIKIKTQNKFILHWGGKGNHEIKGSIQIADKNKLWTLSSSLNSYFWGIKHDESRFLYSVTEDWKVGAGYNSKGPQFVIQNGKLDRPWINSFGLYGSNRNLTMIIKNKLDRNIMGKMNYEIALQSKLMPNSLKDLTFGLTLNVNK